MVNKSLPNQWNNDKLRKKNKQGLSENSYKTEICFVFNKIQIFSFFFTQKKIKVSSRQKIGNLLRFSGAGSKQLLGIVCDGCAFFHKPSENYLILARFSILIWFSWNGWWNTVCSVAL